MPAMNYSTIAELYDVYVQTEGLATIHSHLTEEGHLICTLHNPAIRLRYCDGQIHWREKYALPDQAGNLLLSTLENYEAEHQLVKGFQFYELYAADGTMQSKRFVEIQFFVHTRESFETLARSQGYVVTTLYGDYARNEFQAEDSPFMIWVLGKR